MFMRGASRAPVETPRSSKPVVQTASRLMGKKTPQEPKANL